MQLNLTVALVGIACLIVVASFFAASEASLLALSRLRIQQRNGATPKLVRLLDERNQFLTTILVGNTVVLLADHGDQPVALIFGEIVPKMLVVQDAEKWAPRFAGFLQLLNIALRPVTWSVVGVTSWIIRLFGGDPTARGPFVTEDDIRALVNVGEEHGALEEEEKEMIHSIFEFGDTVVREVMTPRPDIVAISAEATKISITSSASFTIANCSVRCRAGS